MSKVLIVGGVAGGASASARLRRLDESAQIIMFEKGEYISFANCGLPYYIGGDITEKSALTVQTAENFRTRFNVDVRVFNEVIKIDRANKCVTVKNHKTGETYEETYDKMILSPGAEPLRPNAPGFDHERVFTLRNIPDTYKIKDYIDRKKPKSAVVVGGGYIGIEVAENLHNAGLDVTIVEFADHVIAPLDYDMAADVHNHIRQKGVTLILQDGVKSIAEKGEQLSVELGQGEILTDMVIMSVGIRPETKIAQDAGIEVNPRGAIIVDDGMRTNDPDIYAAGDAVEITDYITGAKGYVAMAGPANKQGRIAADNICGLGSKYTGTQGSGVLRCFDLTVATTGITEKRAKDLGLNYEKSFTYSTSHASYYPGATSMSIKIIFSKDDGKLLGAQAVGYEGVDKRMDVLATAIRAKMTVYDLTKLELCYAPPFSSAKDPVNMAGFVAENILSGKMKIFHWHDVEALQKEKDIVLLDVRTAIEYENGHIEGTINIPLDELRTNLDKLDKSKPIYINCVMGQKGHVACRLLMQNGYTCYNLSGGYRLWNSIFKKKVAVETKPQKEATVVTTETNANVKVIEVNACGLQCPGPIVKLAASVKEAGEGDTIKIQTTDPAFAEDVEVWCRRTNNTFGGLTSAKGISTATVIKGSQTKVSTANQPAYDGKNIIVFSGDLDKAIAAFIIANGSAAMGRKVSMFFTFWGLNILRKPEKVSVTKDIISKMFGAMMPRGSKKLALSQMNMGGMGAKMIRMVMKNKNVDSLESLIQASIDNGVELVACSMSMDIMGIKKEELIDGIKEGGVAAMLGHAEESDMSLFI